MKILILGQTPPPYGGQAINIEKLIHLLAKHSFDHHVIRMNFSDEINDMGSFSLKKAIRLLRIFLQLLIQLVVYRPDFVYYPPAGPQRTPIFRDMILLLPVRLFCFKTVFHFHAGGIAESYNGFNPILRSVYRLTYFYADHAICLSEYGKKDPQFLRSKNIVVIPSGAEDTGYDHTKNNDGNFVILFAGLCCESKGILEFIEVIRTAKNSTNRIKGKVLGKIFSSKENAFIQAAINEGLISYEGVQTGELKKEHFRTADLFLFPSFFESENFPTVIIEAFAAGLPVVATNWRGITDQVINGHNGFLHEPHDIKGMAASIMELERDQAMYKRFSVNARQDFETKYTMGIFEESIITVFKSFE